MRRSADYGVSWRTLYPFYGTMEFLDTFRYGGNYHWMKDVETGITYPIFGTDIVYSIDHGLEVSGGKMTGLWCGSKKGPKYGIKVYVK